MALQTKIAVIPAFQPQPVLIQMLVELRKSDYHIIVIDDGSGSEYDGIFRQAESYASVLRHNDNYGKGHALKTGFSYIRSHFPQEVVVITLDADGQHRVMDAEKLYHTVCASPDILAVGSRKIEKGTPLRSRVGNIITRYVYRFFTKNKVYDTQSGLRAFSGRMIPVLLNIPGERYEYEMNVLLLCPNMGIDIKEVGIQTIYLEQNAASHFNPIKDSFRIYREIFKFSASSLVSFLVDYVFYIFLLYLTKKSGNANLVLANTGARIASASVNYMLNRNIVFKDRNKMPDSFLKYAVLACAILIGNTYVLNFIVEQTGAGEYIAKICTEMLFFLVSYFVQSHFIFSKYGLFSDRS